MHTKAVYRIARGLRSAGAVVLRFNYRGVNLSEGEYAHGEGELDDARAALAYLRGRYPDSAVHAGGILLWIAHRAAFGLRRNRRAPGDCRRVSHRL